MTDLLVRGRRRWEPPESRPWPLAIPFGRYELVRRIPSGPDDECYWGRLVGPSGFDKLVFVRRFAASRLGRRTSEQIRKQAHVQLEGVTQIFELGTEGEWGYVTSDLIEGVSVVELAAHRVPWLVALAIAHDACSRLLSMHVADVDPAASPGRVILERHGKLILALGVPATRAPWHRAVCDLVHPILALAASPDERVLLRELFADDSPDAIWVLSDTLVERHPELDPVLPMLFLSLAGRIERETARAALDERLRIDDVDQLWRLVNERVRAKF